MTLFKNQTHQDIWIEHHCHRCWRNGACTILDKALRTNRKPVEWERNPRKNVLMQDSIKCNEQAKLPPPVARFHYDGDMSIDVPMFDVAAPINMDGDHA